MIVKFPEINGTIDLKKLKDQKLNLLEILGENDQGNLPLTKAMIESIEGIIQLIDSIQDAVMATGDVDESEIYNLNPFE